MTLPLASVALMVVSGLMLDAHRRTWFDAQHNRKLGTAELRAAAAQYRRRMQASGLVGVMGGMLLLWPLVAHQRWVSVGYLLLLFLLLGCLLILAMVDAVANCLRIGTARRRAESAQARLQAELDAIGDRQAPSDDSPQG